MKTPTAMLPSSDSLCYIILQPVRRAADSHNWRVFKRNRYRQLEPTAETTSYESAVATLPSGLCKQGPFFDVEFWES
jgi:hypothetical protein